MSKSKPLAEPVVNFAEIRRRRESKTLTLDEAARRAGAGGKNPQSWWAKIEAGHVPDPRISRLAKIAKVLNCRVDDLLA